MGSPAPTSALMTPTCASPRAPTPPSANPIVFPFLSPTKFGSFSFYALPFPISTLLPERTGGKADNKDTNRVRHIGKNDDYPRVRPRKSHEHHGKFIRQRRCHDERPDERGEPAEKLCPENMQYPPPLMTSDEIEKILRERVPEKTEDDKIAHHRPQPAEERNRNG